MENEGNENKGDKLLYSLHEQFAENQNHHQGIFIQLLVSLLVLFGGFGYVFVHTKEDIEYSQTYINDFFFSNSILLSVSLVVILVLLLLNLIVLHLGYSFRRDQYLNMKIRMHILKEEYSNIFDELYNPLNKKYWSYLPNFYAIFFWAITISQIVIFAAICGKGGLVNFNKYSFYLIELSLCILAIVSSFIYYRKSYNKYKKLERNKNN
ncbi:hypothetical protein [Bacteroides ihuae]|uniref:hypothetical protein n=1 Tax=Bacteroides ihuae TaxID=1852362 RepID=UPI0008D9F4CD|nr:hypothetical protein [Bacteroides ihuae]